MVWNENTSSCDVPRLPARHSGIEARQSEFEA
jgi:hypothetical protein